MDSENIPKDNTKAEINDNDDNNNDNQHHPRKPEDDQDFPQEHGVDSLSSSTKSPSDSDPKHEKGDTVVSESKEEEDRVEIKLKESSPLPPDLNKVSEEIDQYISSLINSNESTSPDMPIFIEQFLVLVEDMIEDYDSRDSPVKWSRLTDEDSASFLEAVNRVSSLSKGLSKFSSEYKCAYSINRIGSVLQRAMSYVEEEFKSLLEDYKIHDSDPSNRNDTKSKQSTSSSSSNQESDKKEILGYSEEILSDLIRLSKAMIAGGYESECCQVYFVVRRNALEESLQKIGFEKRSIDDVHKMSWESLEREIEAWIKKFKKFANLHVSNERKLFDNVFSGHPSISESLFGSLCRSVMIQLLNFAEAIALTKRAAEKLFKFLDTYEALRDTVAEIDSLFAEEGQAIELKTEALMIRSHLGEAMILIFNELENSIIKADSGKTPAGGAVHPLTKYIMNYLEHGSLYKQTLEQVFMEHQKIDGADSEIDYNSHNQNPNKVESMKQSPSPFQAQILKIVDLLDANIEAKSKLYKDPSLSSIFMMNNGRFTLKKIKRSNELNSLLGENWYRKKSSDLRQYHKGYQRETWGKLLSCLNPEGLTVNGKIVKPLVKERFKSFNTMFDEIHKTQSNWVIADEQLQSELRVSISNMVIPAYRSFLGRYSQVFTPGRQTEKYVKHQPEDLETSIDELFSGTATPMGRKKQ